MELPSKRNLIRMSCVVGVVAVFLQFCEALPVIQEEDVDGSEVQNGTTATTETQEAVEASPGSRREFFGQFIPKPIKNIFDKFDKKKSSEENVNEVTSITTKSIDIFVADVLHGIAKVTNSVKKTIDVVGENIVKTFIPTAGLDSNKTFFNGLQAEFKNKVRAIYPGTLWCGDGTNAREFNDLGAFDKTDNCCRSHDFCSNSIETGETKYGLINSGLFTRSHCDCDVEFYECLKQANTLIALKIGYTYFTVLGPQCFREDYPIKRCARTKRGPLGTSRCLAYETDKNSSKIYQWYDANFF